MRPLTQIPGMTLAVVLTLVVAQGLVFSPEARAEDGRGLEGTWLVEVTLVDCKTGDPLPIPGNPFPSLSTFMSGGRMLEASAPPPPPGGGTKSSSHGMWERTGDQTFRNRFRFFGFDVNGIHIGTVEVTIEYSLKQGNSSKTDEIIGAGTSKAFTPDGELIVEGCSTNIGQRFEFEK